MCAAAKCIDIVQLLSKTPHQFKDLSNNKVRLKQAGIDHGEMVNTVYSSSCFSACAYACGHWSAEKFHAQIYMHYPNERTVQSVIKKSAFEGRGFGAKMTVEQLIAKQTRIER